MDTTFVIRNQHGHFLSKHREWVDGSDRRVLYRTQQKDEVINLIFELSSRDVDLRATRLECETDADGNPVVTRSDIPLPETANGTDSTETADSGEKEDSTERSSAAG